MNKDVLTVEECARILATSPKMIRRGMINGDLPFGIVIKGERNRYIIPRIQFEKWLFKSPERRDDELHS